MNLLIKKFPDETHRLAKAEAATRKMSLANFVAYCVDVVVGVHKNLDSVNVPRETSEPEKLSTSDILDKAREAFKLEIGRYPESAEELAEFIKETV